MLVKQILEFINRLQYGHLILCDVELSDSIANRFLQRDPTNPIDSNDIIFLVKCFETRWYKVFDTDYDYTINPAGVNTAWIDFAQLLSIEIRKSHLNILIPVVINTRDINNLSSLSETVRLENLYLGSDGVTMYRKRGLCEHLKRTNYTLSTCRDLRTRKLSPISIVELSRLQRCKQPNGAFSVDGEEFTSFWDFLTKKALSHLQDSGQITPQILSSLNQLIQKYYQIKTSGAPYPLFKEQVLLFLDTISHSEVDHANYFYGVKLKYNDVDYYVFELLIMLYQSQDFVINGLIDALNAWMHSLVINQRSHECHSGRARRMSDDFVDLHRDTLRSRCLSLILSLFTNQFSYFPLFGQTIKLWDKTNTVFSAAAEIYSKLSLQLEQNNEEALYAAYQSTMSELIAPVNKQTSFMSSLLNFSSSLEWYKHVQNGTYHNLGVYLFEPELIIHALLKYDLFCSRQNTIYNCLDELVRTYAQKHSPNLKILRVNIFFSEFLRNLTAQQKHLIVNSVQSEDLSMARNHFISNCSHYIELRMKNIFCEVKGRLSHEISFFPSELPVLKVSPDGVEHLSILIDAYIKLVASHNFQPKINMTLQNFIMGLTRPILTVAEREEANKSVRTLDYLNSPS